MVSLITVSKAQARLSQHLKSRRLALGLTQRGLAVRAGVSVPTLRKFEQKGLISLESFLKLLMVLGGAEQVVDTVKPAEEVAFHSIDDVLDADDQKTSQRGRRT